MDGLRLLDIGRPMGWRRQLGLVLFEFNNAAPAHQKPGLEHHDDHDKHDKHGDHDGHMINPHIGLDPQNARVMLRVISSWLGKADPENAEIYAANAVRMATRLAGLQAEIAHQLAP